MAVRGGTHVQRWRVPIGFLCGAVFFVVSRPAPPTLYYGGGIAVLGLALRAWSAGHIRKNDALATSGPYAYSRNPLYLGSFILGLGFTVASGRIWLGLLFAILFLCIYLPVMNIESKTLSQLFGENYQRYAEAVPLFFPRLTPYKDSETAGAKFDAGLYMRYREYQAAVGMVIAWGVLAIEAFVFHR